MAKSSKKSAPKVDVAPAVVPPSKAVKKGKRESADNLEKTVIAKKQKRDEAVEQATQKKKAEVKTQKKKEEASSSEESDSSESEEEKKPVKKPVSASNGAVRKPAKEESSSSSEEDESSEDEKPATKVAAVAKKTVPAKNGAVNSDSSDEDNDDDSEESDDEPQNKKAKVPKVHSNANASKKGSSSDSSDDEDSSGAEKTPKIQKPLDAVKSNAKNDSSDGDDSGDDSSDEEPSKTPKGKPSKESKKYSSESEEESSSEEESEDVPVKNSKKGSDVEMVDAVSPKPTKQANKKAPQIPATPETGSKTLFVGNLSFSVEQADVENFFKDAGEVVDVRFASNEDGSFKGFGHVEFDTHEAAKKALELNGQELLGRGVRLDMARERGAYTASDSKEGNSFQSKGKGQGQTIFVRGFDKFLGEDEIKSSLQKHFGSCGEITRISIPKDYETGSAKGMAYMDFSDADSFNKALELDGAELGGYSLTIEEAKPRGDFGSGGRGGGGRSGGRGGGGRFGGRGGGGRSGGRDFGGRSGGRDFGGRRGGGRGGFGGRGGGGRGHGNKPNLAAAGTGRKTTFGDD